METTTIRDYVNHDLANDIDPEDYPEGADWEGAILDVVRADPEHRGATATTDLPFWYVQTVALECVDFGD